MEEDRHPDEDDPYHKDVSTQTLGNGVCKVCIPEVCDLCNKRILSLSAPERIPVGADLPDNVCQCFFPNNANAPEAANVNGAEEVHLTGDEELPEAANVNVPEEAPFTGDEEPPEVANVNLPEEVPLAGDEEPPEAANVNIPEEASLAGDQGNSGLPNVQIEDSLDANPHPVDESRTEESNTMSETDESSSEEPKLLERSLKSNGSTSSPSDRLLDPLSPCRRTISETSDKSPKNSPNAEKSPISNGHALPPLEQSIDNLPNERNDVSPASERGSGDGSSTEKEVSSGYPLSLDEQSDENLTDRRKSTSPSSGEDSKNFNRKNGVASRQSLHENNLEQLNVSEYMNESFTSNRRETNNRTIREHYQYPLNKNANVQYGSIPTELAKFRSENPRPLLPPPFYPHYRQYYPQSTVPHYQPHRNSAMDMSMSRPSLPHPQSHTQPIQQYGIPTMNMPINRAGIPGRFPVFSRPQMTSTPYHRRPNNEGNGSLSTNLPLPDAEKDLENSNKTVKRIEDWLENLPDPQIDAASAWSIAENEENEGIPPRLSDIFQELSTTEASEEENIKQRSLRRPPRKHKK